MAITISGNGISSDAIASLAASKLTGQVPDANAPSGSVIQVLQTTASTQLTNNTSTYISTGLSLSITPSSSSNKVLVTASVPITFGNNAGNVRVGLRLTRNGTVVWSNFTGNNVSAIVQQFTECSVSFLDSPSTTSATTYIVEFAELGVASRYGPTSVCTNDFTNTATLQLLEIAG